MHNSTIYVFFLLAPTGNRKNTQTRAVHLLVLTRVLIYHNARNEKYVHCGAFVNATMIFVSVTWPGMVS